MSIPAQLKAFALFIDGRSYAGTADDIVLPKLTLKTEEYRAGGMDMPVEIDLGMEKLSLELTLKTYNAELFKLYGLLNQSSKPFTLRGSIEDSDGAKSLLIQCQGFLTGLDFDALKAGENTGIKCTVALDYYKLTLNGNTLIEIDPHNVVRNINGHDQLANRRQHLGV